MNISNVETGNESTFSNVLDYMRVDKLTLRRIVGHADLATADKYYTHLGLDDILEAIGWVDLTNSIRSKGVTKNSRFKEASVKCL